jgi:hypothetical protein
MHIQIQGVSNVSAYLTSLRHHIHMTDMMQLQSRALPSAPSTFPTYSNLRRFHQAPERLTVGRAREEPHCCQEHVNLALLLAPPCTHAKNQPTQPTPTNPNGDEHPVSSIGSPPGNERHSQTQQMLRTCIPDRARKLSGTHLRRTCWTRTTRTTAPPRTTPHSGRPPPSPQLPPTAPPSSSSAPPAAPAP